MELRDADCQSLVEQLVCHHIPVHDAARKGGQTGPENDPQSDRRQLEAEGAGQEKPPKEPPGLSRLGRCSRGVVQVCNLSWARR